MQEKIKGICIKSYQNEDDLVEYQNGQIEEGEIEVHEVGEESLIVDGLYDKEYWKPA